MSQSCVDILTPTTGTKHSELRLYGLFSAWFHIRNRFPDLATVLLHERRITLLLRLKWNHNIAIIKSESCN